MNDTYFYAGDSSPMTGKVPVQARFHGDPAAIEAVRGAANGALSAFLGNVRLGTLSQLRSTAVLPGGGSIEMRHSFGVTSVDVYAPGTGQPGGERFYGGILIFPTILTNEAAYLATGVGPTKATLDAAKSSGKTALLGGRPEVSGTKGLETDALVIQIHPTKPLTGTPIADGAVKIFRIRQPKAGDIYDSDVRAGYVVSTHAPGTDFFVCGKKMANVPALPIAITLNNSYAGVTNRSMLVASLHALSLEIQAFAAADRAEATLVVATATPPELFPGAGIPGNESSYGVWTFRLYAINTKTRTPSTPAVWQTLHEVITGPDFRPNKFGTTFESVGHSVTCSGTNGAGECCGWTVTVTTDGITGALNIVSDSSVAQVLPTTTVTYEATYETEETESVEAVDWTYPTFDSVSSPTFIGGVTYQRYIGYKAVGFNEVHTYTIDSEGGVPAFAYDTFLGGLLSLPPFEEYHYSETGSTSCTFNSFEHRLKGYGRVTATSALLDYQAGVPTSYPDLGPTWDIADPGDDLYLSPAGYIDYYYTSSPYDMMLYGFGELYPFTWEYSGVYDPIGDGIVFPDPPVAESFYSVPAYYEYQLNPDNTDPDPLFEKYPYVPPVPSYQDIPPESSTLIYDKQPIASYPKKAAIFDCDERWEAAVAVSGGSPFDGSFTSTASRVGQTRADEYLAEMWSTNVDSFPDLTPAGFTLAEDGDTLPALAGEFAEPPFGKFAYSARDALTNKLAWRAEQHRSGAWEYVPGETREGKTISYPFTHSYTENASGMQVTMRLLRPDGSVLIEIDDIFSRFPRTPADSLPTSSTVNIPLNAVAQRQWPLRYNDPEHPELDDTRTAKFPFFATIPDSSHWVPVSLTHLYFPKLITAYWGRLATGEDFAPQFPVLKNAGPTSATISRTSAGTYNLARIPGVLTTGISGSALGPRTTNFGDSVYLDPRTGGFLATLNWRALDAGGTGQAFIETYIGNASGAVPLKPIIDEWIALGTPPAQAFTKILLDTDFGNPAVFGIPPYTTRLV